MSPAPKSAALAPSPQGLAARAAQGDQEAVTALFRTHVRYVAGVVYRLLGQDADLDDIVQDTFVEGTRTLGGLRDPSRFRAWIATIAVRRVRRHLARRYRRRELSSSLEKVAPQVSDPADREDIDNLYRALDRIPDDLRIPWVLHHIEGETLPAVAEICESSLSTIKRRIARARSKLERRLHAR